jgi:hypothetical protein
MRCLQPWGGLHDTRFSTVSQPGISRSATAIIGGALHIPSLQRVKSTHYRAAALLSASPQ